MSAVSARQRLALAGVVTLAEAVPAVLGVEWGRVGRDVALIVTMTDGAEYVVTYDPDGAEGFPFSTWTYDDVFGGVAFLDGFARAGEVVADLAESVTAE